MSSKKIKICFYSFIFIVLQLTYMEVTGTNNSILIKDSNQEKVFKAGAATSNITPAIGEEYGLFWRWSSVGENAHIHDELLVRCLVLDDGETRLAFIVVDFSKLEGITDETKRLIQEETNLPKENVMISATHTHSSGDRALGENQKRRGWIIGEPFDPYQEFVIRRIVDVVKIAINNLEPARVGWGVGSIPQHVFVRRWKMKPGTPVPNPFGGQDKVRMNPGRNNPNLLEPAGKPDPEVSFISVESLNGRPIALLANYSLHYVGGVPPGHISADYFGVFADQIQLLLGADRQNPPFVGILSNGTSADVNNNDLGGPSRSYEPYEKMRIVAEDVAREVTRVYNTIQHHDWVSLKSAQEKMPLQVRKPDRQMLTRVEMVMERPDTEEPSQMWEKTFNERVIRLLEWPDQIDIIIQTFRIGEVGIAAIPFEVIAEMGLEIKAKSPFKPSFTVALANGSYGYLPTPEQHELGGYETWLGVNCVEIEASRKIIAKILELFNSLNNAK